MKTTIRWIFTWTMLGALTVAVSACERREAPAPDKLSAAPLRTKAQAMNGAPGKPRQSAETVLASGAMPAEPEEGTDPAPPREPDVVFVPTPMPVVDRMLEVAKVSRDDVIYDLGCGDGRIVVTAAKRYGARGYCFDIDPQRFEEATENVQRNNVAELVTVKQRDIFTIDLSPADVVTLYLLPELNVRLIPQLEKLKPSARVVSHDFDMKGVEPDRHLTMKLEDRGSKHAIYLWHAPIRGPR